MLVQVKESSWIASIAARNLHAAKLAMVFGKKIYLFNTTRSEFLKNRRWVCHELVHVEQYARYGMAGFLIRYLWETIRKGYHHNRFEVEARQRENDERILQGITIR
ncbi:MAG TPA: DUF4157 domain-containing protein [Chitinophagaceae bacterium]